LALPIALLAAPENDEKLPPPPPGYEWKLNPKLSDEFNGAKLDTKKWWSYNPFWRGRVPSRFEPANVSLKNGNLKIRSTLIVSNSATISDPTNEVWIGAGSVVSKAASAACGYYEARMKASALSLTSSFWLAGDYSEIDVVEQAGDPVVHPENRELMMMNTHYFTKHRARDAAKGARWKMPTAAAADYHIYGVWWRDEDSAWFYHDGNKVAEVQFAGKFRENMFLQFDTEAMTWLGLPSVKSLTDTNKNTMSVDWVRSWTLEKDPNTARSK
jgi:hypothetical protein